MSDRLFHKRTLRHSLFREATISTPEDKQRSETLTKNDVNEGELNRVVHSLKQPDCAVERLELVGAKINQDLATILANGISLTKTIKELAFRNC